MADELRTEVEQVKEREDVKQALKQTTATAPQEQPKAKTKDKLWLGTHVIVLIGLAVFYYLLNSKSSDSPRDSCPSFRSSTRPRWQ